MAWSDIPLKCELRWVAFVRYMNAGWGANSLQKKRIHTWYWTLEKLVTSRSPEQSLFRFWFFMALLLYQMKFGVHLRVQNAKFRFLTRVRTTNVKPLKKVAPRQKHHCAELWISEINLRDVFYEIETTAIVLEQSNGKSWLNSVRKNLPHGGSLKESHGGFSWLISWTQRRQSCCSIGRLRLMKMWLSKPGIVRRHDSLVHLVTFGVITLKSEVCFCVWVQ